MNQSKSGVHRLSKWGPFAAICGTGITFIYYCLQFSLPPPGVSIGLLAVAAAVMTLRPPMLAQEKAGWLLLVGLLAAVEIRSISKNESQNLADRESQNKSFREIKESQQTKFQETADSLVAAYDLSQEQFDKTKDQVDGVLRTTRRVASISRQSLEAIIGKDSAPCVIPHPDPSLVGSMGLDLVDIGKNPLTGVVVKVTNMTHGLDYDAESRAFFLDGGIDIGTLTNTGFRRVPGGIAINRDFGGYRIDVWTQNGMYTEDVLLLRDRTKMTDLDSGWIWWYRTSRYSFSFDRKSGASRTIMNPIDGCTMKTWSDGKPFNDETPLHR